MNQDLLEPSKDENSEGAISRRVFLGAAGGSLVVIPAAAGGFLITPQFVGTAYADDAPTDAQSKAGETRLVIAKSSEVGVTVYDMTSNTRKPIADAAVTVMSHATKKTKSAKTNSKGVAVIDIADMAEEAGKKETPSRYEFDGKIEVKAKGFRIFRTGRIHFSGAKGVPVPTRAVDSDIPYPALVAFDDWDVLYTQNEFAVAKGNTTQHTIDIELENAGASDISVSLHSGDAKELVSGIAKSKNGKAAVSFRRSFLRAGHSEALPVGKDFFIEYTYNGITYQCPIALILSNAVPGGDKAQAKPGLTLSPFGASAMMPGINIKFPKSWWVIGGMSFKPYIPEFKNFEYSFNPFGYFRVAVKSGEYGKSWKNKEGKWASDGWMYQPRKTFEQNAEKTNEAVINTIDKTWDKLSKGDKFFQSAELVRSFSAGVSGQIQLAGKWDDPSGLVRGQFQGSATLLLKYSLGWQFLIGYVPLFLEIGINASFTLGFGAAWATPSVFEPSKYIWDYANSGLDFTMAIVPSISLALGVRGVIAVGGKISATFTVFVGIFGLKQLPEGAEKNGISYPHVVGGFSWSISIFFMLFGHVWTPKTWDPHKWPEAFDNWKGGWQPPFESWNGLSAQADAFDFASLLEGAKMITDESLRNMAEFDVDDEQLSSQSDTDSSDDSLKAQSESDVQAFPKIETKTEIVESAFDDGTLCRYVVLTPVEKRQDKEMLMAATAVGLNGSPSSGAGQSAKAGEKLYAQAASGSETEYVAQAVDNPATVSVIGDHKHNFKIPAPEIKALASDQGLVPSSDIELAHDVMCDSRMKMATICGCPFAFRIASCLVGPNDAPRLRVTAQQLSGDDRIWDTWVSAGRKHTSGPTMREDVNFDDLYDYDFAVYAEPEVVEPYAYDRRTRHSSIVHLFVISGFRKDGNNTSIEEVVCDQMLTYYQYEFYYIEGYHRGVTTLQCKTISAKDYNREAFPGIGGDYRYKHHMFSCPHITVIEDKFAECTSRSVVMTFLDRATDKDDKRCVLSTEKFDVDILLGMMFFTLPSEGKSAYINRLLIPNAKDVPMGPILDYSIYELACTDRVDGQHIITLRGNELSHYLAMRTTSGDKGELPRITSVKHLEAREDWLKLRLVYWKGHGGFLASVGGEPVEGVETDSGKASTNAKLQYVTISDGGSNGELQLSLKDVGPQNFNVKTFDVDPSGRFIFYPSSRCGNTDGDYGDAKHDMGDDVETYRIMACKFLGDRFSEPFVFAEIEHPMDTLYAYKDSASAMAFASTEVTDAERGKGNLWYTSMPHIRSATLIQCTGLTAYAFPGEKALFEVAVRNDGNTYLSGFTANLFEKGQKTAASKTPVVFSKDTLVESNWNPANDDGSLQNVEADYSLAPGATSVYRIAMPVPSSWSGTKTIVITVSEAVLTGTGALSAQAGGLSPQADGLYPMADDDCEEWYVDYTTVEDYPDEKLYMPKGYEVDSEELEDAPITVLGSPDDVNGGKGGGSDERSGNSSNRENVAAAGNSTSTTAKTGDSLGALGLAAAAAAAAGAAFAAYSNRRVAIERGEDPGSIIDVEGDGSDD